MDLIQRAARTTSRRVHEEAARFARVFDLRGQAASEEQETITLTLSNYERFEPRAVRPRPLGDLKTMS